MAYSFKRELYGFNREDVLLYIQELLNKNEENEIADKSELLEMTKKANELEEALENAQKSLEEVTKENEELKAQIETLNKEKEDLEGIANDMSRMYVTSKANAQSGVQGVAIENVNLVKNEVANTLQQLEDAQKRMDLYGDNLGKIVANYKKNIDAMFKSLGITKVKLDKNNEKLDSIIAKMNDGDDSADDFSLDLDLK